MEKITEQWKKGELEDGRYYFRHNDNSTPFAWFGSKNVYDGYSNDEVVEVLAPVPSYEEYLSLTYAKEEDEKIIAEYEKENKALKQKVVLLEEEVEHWRKLYCIEVVR